MPLIPRVLCVDDDEDSRIMLVALLKYARVESKAVGRATQALSLIQSERFDLYLTDARLPGIDGFELCHRIRHIDPITPILFFSGSASPADQKKGIDAGANAYVIKPDVDGLLSTIKQFVSLADSPTAQEIPARREASDPRRSPFNLGEPLYVS